MRYSCYILFFLLAFSIGVNAQQDTTAWNSVMAVQASKMEGFLSNLQIKQDQRITDLIVRHSQINQRKRGTNGYRLEIFFSSTNKAREQAMKTKNDFNLIFPEINSYLLYQMPNFKVRVGDFRNKSEALKAKALIESKYPNAFIVKDVIRFPELITGSKEYSTEQ